MFASPTEGEILFNDVPAQQYDVRVLRANMSVLFQDFRNPVRIEPYTNLKRNLPVWECVTI